MNDRIRDFALLAPHAGDLLRLYRPGASVYASPRRSLIAQGTHVALPHGPAATLAQRASQLLADVKRDDSARPVLMGAVPFCADNPARLFVPEGVVFGLGVEGQPPQRLKAAPPRRAEALRPVPTPAGYRRNVQQALARIEAGGFDKVVLSRSLTVAAAIDRPTLLKRLMARNPVGHTFAIDLADGPSDGPARTHSHTPARTLMGASPELLLSRSGLHIGSHPLAGSIPRGSNDADDQRRAQGLLRSAKDLREHAFVVDAVAAALRPFCRTLNVPAAPSLVATPTLWHLGTHIVGELADASVGSLDLAMALHPTPAVCGHPVQAARRFISDTEGFARGFFAGLVGWCDGNGDGEWAVTIRCAEVDAQSATLYAGAGIVAGSDPDAELAETTAKLRTLLQAMDLDGMTEDMS